MQNGHTAGSPLGSVSVRLVLCPSSIILATNPADSLRALSESNLIEFRDPISTNQSKCHLLLGCLNK